MNHQEAVKLLPWYVNGTLEAEERHNVQKHLKRCFQCKAQLEEWEKIGAVVGELGQDAPQPPSRLPRQVVEQIQLEEREAGPRRLEKQAPTFWWRSKRLLQMAAVILFAAVAVQNLYLRRELDQLSQPQTLPPFQISAEIRGSATVELPQQARWLPLQVEIPPPPLDRSYSELHWLISSENDEALFSGRARVAASLDLLLPASKMGPGSYILVVTGTEQGQVDEISTYTIDLQRK